MYRFRLFFILTLCLVFIQGRSEIIEEGDNESSKIIVDWIVKKQGLYIIYAIMEPDSSQIIIVSRNKRCSFGEIIKEDSLYSIRLDLQQKEDFLIPDHLLIFEIILEGKTFKVPTEGWSTRLYTSPDLVGLKIKRASSNDF